MVTAIHLIASFNAGRFYTERCPFYILHCMAHTGSGMTFSADGLADPVHRRTHGGPRHWDVSTTVSVSHPC
jgi:hypothetical protein